MHKISTAVHTANLDPETGLGMLVGPTLITMCQRCPELGGAARAQTYRQQSQHQRTWRGPTSHTGSPLPGVSQCLRELGLVPGIKGRRTRRKLFQRLTWERNAIRVPVSANPPYSPPAVSNVG